MTIFVFANDAKSTIASPISDSATTIVLATGTGAIFPNPGAGEQFSLTLIDASTQLTKEIVYCTARVVDTLTVVRGRENTAARAWNAGDIAANQYTAGQAGAFQQNATTSGVLLATLIFTANDTLTLPAGTNSVKVALDGGGASGGGCPATDGTHGAAAGGGGAGAHIEVTFTAVEAAGASIVIGLGAAPGAAGDPGNGGGESVFGGVHAPGGIAGFAGTAVTVTAVTGGSGNTNLPTSAGGTVLLAVPGETGGVGIVGEPSNVASGQGGRSFYGPGGSNVSDGPGTAGRSPGSGGSGASLTINGSATVGGQGADGICYVYCYS